MSILSELNKYLYEEKTNNDINYSLLNKYNWNFKKSTNGIYIYVVDNDNIIAKFSNYSTDEGQENDIWVHNDYQKQGIGLLGTLLLMQYSYDNLDGFQWDVRGLTSDGERLSKKADKIFNQLTDDELDNLSTVLY